MQVSEQDIRAQLQKIWGYPDFRPPQGEIVRSILHQQDTLIVLPTGAGKSICFQFRKNKLSRYAHQRKKFCGMQLVLLHQASIRYH